MCSPIRRSDRFTIVSGSTLRILRTQRRVVLVVQLVAAVVQLPASTSQDLTGAAARRPRGAGGGVFAESFPTCLVGVRQKNRSRHGHNRKEARTSRCL